MTQTRLKPGALSSVAGKVDPIWDRLRSEAEAIVQAEPALAGFVLSAILHQPSLEAAVIHRVASRLGHAGRSGRHHRADLPRGGRERPVHRRGLPGRYQRRAWTAIPS